jgi:putative radical SAM enzyme (TIGR03279 family)
VPAALVVSVAPGSPAARAGLGPGDEILAVNGSGIRDVIEYQLAVDESRVELDVRCGGLDRTVVVDKAEGAPLGLELSSAVFDRVRTCDNHCPFCFVHQLPKGLRRSLYVKDDDYRLSFLYGNFTTLTRFTEADFERVVEQRLDPLYVSIHATDPEVRSRLLRNRRGATSLRWLELLIDAGLTVHGQVVVCPGVNDGAVLDATMAGILDRFAGLRSVGVVPLGVSSFNREAEMRPHTVSEAGAVLDVVDGWRDRFRSVLGRRLAHAADEYYLLAGRPFPEPDEYDGFEQIENGIGMARRFELEVDAARRGEPVAPAGHEGFFAWVEGADQIPEGGAWEVTEGAPADGYRAARSTAPRDGGAGRPVTLVTGEYGARVLGARLDALQEYAGHAVDLLPVRNRFFGGNIAVTGLLAAADVAAAIGGVPAANRVVIPDVVLSRDRFIDGGSLADLPRPVEVVGSDGAALVAALASS